MPVDTVALIVCGVLLVGGIAGAALAFVKRRPGRALQAIGIALLPLALYFAGLLRLVVSMIGALVVWLTRLVFVPTVWIGFGVLALAVLLWFAGARVALHDRDRVREEKQRPRAGSKPTPAVRSTTPPSEVGSELSRPAAKPAKPVKGSTGDPELDEIAELLRSRGIN